MAKDKVVYPEGYYKVRVISNTMTTAKSSGDPYVAIKVEVVEQQGRRTGSKDIQFGGHRYVNLYSSPKTIDSTRDILLAAGYDPSTHRPEQLLADNADHLSLAGFEFAARCSHEEWNGETRDKFSPAMNWRVANPNGWMDNMEKPSHRQVSNFGAMLGVANHVPAPITTGAAVAANPFN